MADIGNKDIIKGPFTRLLLTSCTCPCMASLESLDMPEDLIVEILVKLPVKSLLRFRCVSKSWCSLLINPSFISEHLINNKKNKKENGCLFVHNFDYEAKKYAFAMYPDKTLTVPAFEYLDLKLNARAQVLGPCNGIFCLIFSYVDNSIALWNPATRELRALPGILPHLPNNIPPAMKLEKNAFGFGMDPLTNDYKVVCIRIYWDENIDLRDMYNPTPKACYLKHVSIYSLRDDSWREFKGFFPECYVHCAYNFYPYVDGVFYWTGYDKKSRSVYLSFDMGYEVFKVIPEQGLPGPLVFQGIPELGVPGPEEDECGSFPYVESCFGVYNDSLTWIRSYPTSADTPNVFNIWMMKEEHAWRRELIIGPFVGAVYPLGFWKTGELLVEGRDMRLFLANPLTLEMKDLGTVAFQAFIYHESLVSVKPGRNHRELVNSSYDDITNSSHI